MIRLTDLRQNPKRYGRAIISLLDSTSILTSLLEA
jgi:hypothetical protein